jgi:zinc transport system ATP-binding protein
MMRKEIIKLEKVTFSYNKEEFLKDITLSIYEDDFLGVIGPNGGGKTTILKLIMGIIKPQRGKITIFGESPKKVRNKIGYLSQFKNVDFDFPITVHEIVLSSRVGSNLFKKYSKKDKKVVERVMKDLDIWKFKDKNINEVSGGEKQRVFVARALANDPKALILDEPMSNLDFHIQEEFYKILKKLNEKIAIVIVDHDLETLSKYAKEVVCVNKCKTHALRYHVSDSIKMRGMSHA